MSDHQVFIADMDQGEWTVEVLSPDDDPYRGVLTVTRTATGEVIHRQEVPISYAARFGPDVDDIAAWHELCADVVDNPEKRQAV